MTIEKVCCNMQNSLQNVMVKRGKVLLAKIAKCTLPIPERSGRLAYSALLQSALLLVQRAPCPEAANSTGAPNPKTNDRESINNKDTYLFSSLLAR